MAQRLEQRKAELVEQVGQMVRERLRPEQAEAAGRLVRRYYAGIAPEDVAAHDPETLYGAAMALWTFLQARKPGAPKLRIYTPSEDEQGWSSDHSVVEIINDDMPFLVDSVSQALQAFELTVHLVVHPIIGVTRDAAGNLTGLADPGAPGMAAESAMHIEIDRVADPELTVQIVERLTEVLADVRSAVEDWRPMLGRMEAILDNLDQAGKAVDADEVGEAYAFLRWLVDDHFTFLGYRSLTFTSAEDDSISVDAGSGLGLLRSDEVRVLDESRSLALMPAEVRAFLRRSHLLLITKGARVSTVHRAVPLDFIGIKRFDAKGRVCGLHVITGLFTAAAYTQPVDNVPVLRQKVATVMERAGAQPGSHDWRALAAILETYPRDELFQIGVDALSDAVRGILGLQERKRVALFVRRDEIERFVSCLVYVPRDRYDTGLRHAIQGLLERAWHGRVTNYYTQVADSPLARLHFIVSTTPGAIPEPDLAMLEAQMAELARAWPDRLRDALVETHGEATGLKLFRRYGRAFPASYCERHGARSAVADVERIDEAVRQGIALALHRPVELAAGEARLKLFHPKRTVALSDVLPTLENLGFRVISEVPHEIHGDETVWLHEFGLEARYPLPDDLTDLRDRFHDAFLAIWRGDAEDDGLGHLVVAAGLSWREVVILRAYVRYMRQIGTAFGQGALEATLGRQGQIAALLVRLFHARFNPKASLDAAQVQADLDAALDAVTDAEDDRILRRLRALIDSTLRTNAYQRDAAGQPKAHLSLKLDSKSIADLPLPRPHVEVFVYSPRVEAIHLRGGKVARGGIRWSDRRADFRTEVLGLMKAQMVKNAVIVPVGSKGGFVVKKPPVEATREAQQEEGIACYRTMMRGLLDITDNLAEGEVVPPADVRRYDGDDPYLVVAADKGTATFSDIANGISQDYGFWLDDAFASGGSKGYDHKAMGITARGAWVSVQRHFRELGLDVQTEDFTVVGVGDMSGDVFGNGMLRSKHIRLVAAFDHRHVFLDPDPDSAASFAERERLFKLPRSSWADYDASKLSPGGGIFPRSAKLVPLSPQVKARFGIEADALPPEQLIRALLTASVDLLWFGGIGTYVKSAHETNAEVGDRANDGLRVDGGELRARVIGEGANLAVTQRGRIDYALHGCAGAGGHLNTDAIDNSAGVDTSDHEVNIKILVNGLVDAGELTGKQRDKLLVEMTDEVAALVLRDNYLQTQALSLMEAQAAQSLDAHVRVIRRLEKLGRLNRSVEFLPDDEELARRAAARRGLTRPEMAVLIGYVKLWLFDLLIASDLPDDPLWTGELELYFPTALRNRFAPAIASHRLRREIIATAITNSIVNRVGIGFLGQMMEATGRSAADVARAYAVVRDAFQLRGLWAAVEALDYKVAPAVQMRMLAAVNRLIEHSVAWVLRRGGRPGAETLTQLSSAAAVLTPRALPPTLADADVMARQDWVAAGAPAELAAELARLPLLLVAGDIARVAAETGLPQEQAVSLYLSLGDHLGLLWLRDAADDLPAADQWQRLAADSLVDELHARHVAIAAAASADAETWLAAHAEGVEAVQQLLAELRQAAAVDLAALTVASHRLRSLTDN